MFGHEGEPQLDRAVGVDPVRRLLHRVVMSERQCQFGGHRWPLGEHGEVERALELAFCVNDVDHESTGISDQRLGRRLDPVILTPGRHLEQRVIEFVDRGLDHRQIGFDDAQVDRRGRKIGVSE